ncbi:MAG: site-specific integrase [Candidatus Methanomethylicaceae archaeon]
MTSIESILNQDFVKNNESIKTVVMRVYRKSMSELSARDYATRLEYFFNWLGVQPDKAKNMKFDWEAKINEFIDELVAKKIAPRTIRTWVAAVKKWMVMCNISINWHNVELPSVWNSEQERMMSKEDLRKLLTSADLLDRVIILCLVSSGLRVGTLTRLRLKDVDMNYDCPLVRVRPEIAKRRQGHITFFSSEAKNYLMTYLHERERNGEKLTPDSPLISAEWRRGSPMGRNAISHRWIELLRASNMNQKGRRWNLYRIHGLRKFFKSWATMSGVSKDLVEYWMGHRSSIAQTYLLPNLEESSDPKIIEKVMVEYRKVEPALTIFSDEEKIKELENKIEQQAKIIEERERQFEEQKKFWVAELENMRRQLAEMEKRFDQKIRTYEN